MHDDARRAPNVSGIWVQPPELTPAALQPRPRYYLPAAVADLSLPYSKKVAPENADEAPALQIRNNIAEILNKAPEGITLAQRSNFIPPTAWVYEDAWRKKSIGWLSGEAFSFDDERALLLDWLAPANGELLLDIGCSSGFYARSLQQAAPEAAVAAIDFSRPMLQDARKRARAEGRRLYLLQADAQALPFAAQSAEGLACGGSLNEFARPEIALKEARRIIKPGGRFFMMHLLEAKTSPGRWLQKSAETGGLHFWSKKASEALFEKTGFRMVKEKSLGMVMFSLLEPA